MCMYAERRCGGEWLDRVRLIYLCFQVRLLLVSQIRVGRDRLVQLESDRYSWTTTVRLAN